MYYWFLFLLPLLFSPVFAQTLSDVTPSQYILKFDGHTFDISYVVNGDVLAMDIDPESKSLLIGVKNTHNSQFIISLTHEIISAPNNEFLILVNGQEVYYDITSNSDVSTFTFFVPEGTEEIEIVGTFVIPEFPIGSIFVYALIISSIVIFAKVKVPFFKL